MKYLLYIAGGLFVLGTVLWYGMAMISRDTPAANTDTIVTSNTVPHQTISTYRSNFGYSFTYPKTSTVEATTTRYDATVMYGDGTKVIGSVISSNFYLDEVESPAGNILSQSDAGPIGSHYNKYFYDKNERTWKYEHDEESPEGAYGTTTVATTTTKTGLPLLPAYTRFGMKNIIPLGETRFVVTYALCNDATDRPCTEDEKARYEAAVRTLSSN